MTNSTIRVFKDDDLSGLTDLWQQCGLTRPWNDPVSDINIARQAQETEIFVAESDDQITGSVIAGFDGHRGWVYYLAVHPSVQKQGLGRALMIKAETFLKSRNCPKLELMIRPENTQVRKIYENLGYDVEDRTLMVKWLKEPPSKPEELSETVRDQKLPIVISYLEMTVPPKKAARPLPQQPAPVSLVKLQDIPVAFYRYLYNTIGEQWMWWEKRIAPDNVIEEIVTRPDTDQYLLSVGGVPAGWVQLDNLGNFEDRGQTMEIGYFGLFPDFIGRGLGPYLLDFAIHTAWAHESKPARVQLNTCTLDHRSALPTYQKAGFSIYDRETIVIDDPRLSGIIPKDIELAQPLPPFPNA